MQEVPPDAIDSAAAGSAAMRGGFLRTASFAGSLVIGLVSVPLLVRHLGEAGFGRYSTALAIVAIVAGLTEGGVATIALRELSVAKEQSVRRRLMGDLLGLRLMLSSAGVAVAVAFTAVAGYGEKMTLGVLVAGIGMVLLATQLLLAVVLQSQLRFGWVAVIELARGTVAVCLIVALVLAGAGLVAFLAVSIPAAIAALALTVRLVRGQTRLRPALAPRRTTALLREVLLVAMALAVYALYFRVALLVTSLVSSAQQTGYFAIPFRLMEALIGIPVLLIGAAFPIIARSAVADRERFASATHRIYELALYLGGMLALGLLLSAPFAIEVLAGAADHPSVEVLQIQSAALVAGFVVAAASFPLLSMRSYRELLIANSGALLVALALALALAPSRGAVGAAIAAVSADLVLAATLTVMLVRRGGPALPLPAIGVTIAAGLAGYGGGRLLGLHPLVDAAAGCLIFLGMLALLGRFPPELREMLASRTTSAADSA